MRFSKINRLFAIVALAALVCIGANASTVTYNSPVDTYTQKTDFIHQFVLPLWNPTLFSGQSLTSATIFFTMGVDVTNLTLANTSGTSQTFGINVTSGLFSLTLAVPGSSDAMTNIGQMVLFNIAHNGATLGPSGSGICPTGSPSSACSTVSFNPASVLGTSTFVASDLNNYRSSGSFTITADTLSTYAFDGGGNNISALISENATQSAWVTYTYQDSGIPEPATMALLGSALVGLGVLGRKRFFTR
jgi:hypothetical protein